MTRLIRFLLPDNTFVLVEVDEAEDSGGSTNIGRDDDLVADARQTFDQALDSIRTSTETAITKLRSLSKQPDEIEMEFGFNLSGEFGAVIAKVTAEANYKVTLKWSTHQGEGK